MTDLHYAPLHIRSMFNTSVNQQQRDKKDLLAVAHNTFAATKWEGTQIYLPTEIWEMIFDISHCVDTCQTHVVFKKERVYNRNTYFTFSGTFDEFKETARIAYMDSLIFDDQGECDELPWDHHCKGACGDTEDCPMLRGAVCSSIWKIMEFNTQKELKLYESLIPRAYSYYGHYEVKNFKSLANHNGNEQGILCASQGDTHKSICGAPPSKGPQQVCAHCTQLFYMSDKHYFDDEHQLEYCGWRCHAMANGILPEH
jgi:hypothetical protein